jgi:hypothetical protein
MLNAQNMNNITILDNVSSSGFPVVGAQTLYQITKALEYLHIPENPIMQSIKIVF